MNTCAECGHSHAEQRRYCTRCGSKMKGAPEQAHEHPSPLQSGALLDGKYQILSEIERGGMGVVYCGTDLTLGRKVAIKVLPAHLSANPEIVARFRREARAMATLDHPNIVQVYAIGQEDGFHYFAMKYLEGRTVADDLRTMRIQNPPRFYAQERVVEVLSKVADGLRHAHNRGLIHRDIKPSNIMLGPDGQVTIMDFGIVKQQAATGTPLTQVGMVFGTPEYMAPEQAQGHAQPSATTDLYALGVVAYEMIAGYPPFRGPTSVEVVLKHIQEAPEPITVHRPDLEPELAALVMQLFHKEPTARYQSCEAVLTALNAQTLTEKPRAARQREVVPDSPRPHIPQTQRSGVSSKAPPRMLLDADEPPPPRSASSASPGHYTLPISRADNETKPNPVPLVTASASFKPLKPTRMPQILGGIVLLALAAFVYWPSTPEPVEPKPSRPRGFPVVVDAGRVDALIDAELEPDLALPKVIAQVHIKSTPNGAQIFSPSDLEHVLGTTPELIAQPKTLAITQDLILRKPGYLDLRVTVSFIENTEYVLVLKPAPKAPASVSP